MLKKYVGYLSTKCRWRRRRNILVIGRIIRLTTAVRWKRRAMVKMIVSLIVKRCLLSELVWRDLSKLIIIRNLIILIELLIELWLLIVVIITVIVLNITLILRFILYSFDYIFHKTRLHEILPKVRVRLRNIIHLDRLHSL